MPLAEMAGACRARGVAVLVDGAHAPGAIELDVGALGVDWYAANLHKWAFAPRSCGILWAAPERRAELHPPVLSWGVTGGDWLQEFDWPGTRDPSPWLAAPAGLDFMHDVLGVEAMREYNHALAWQGAVALARRWEREWVTPESMVGCMVTVPLPARLGSADEGAAQRLRDALLAEHGDRGAGDRACRCALGAPVAAGLQRRVRSRAARAGRAFLGLIRRLGPEPAGRRQNRRQNAGRARRVSISTRAAPPAQTRPG